MYKTENELQIGKSSLFLFQSSLREIGSPDYLLFLINHQKKKLAIKATSADDPDGIYIKVAYYPDYNDPFEIECPKFIKQLKSVGGLQRNSTYSIKGFPVLQEHLIEFDLTDAEDQLRKD